MYPAHVFSIVPPFLQEETVFIAMSLDPRFDTRRHKVIEPAVSRTIENDKPLKLVRVDIPKILIKFLRKFCLAYRTGSGNAVVSELIERIGYCHQLLEIFSKNELSLSKGIRIDTI